MDKVALFFTLLFTTIGFPHANAQINDTSVSWICLDVQGIYRIEADTQADSIFLYGYSTEDEDTVLGDGTWVRVQIVSYNQYAAFESGIICDSL